MKRPKPRCQWCLQPQYSDELHHCEIATRGRRDDPIHCPVATNDCTRKKCRNGCVLVVPPSPVRLPRHASKWGPTPITWVEKILLALLVVGCIFWLLKHHG